MKRVILPILCFLMALTFQLSAQATLSLQGVIKNSDGTAVDNGNYSLTFRLYNTDAGGTPVWEETQDAVSVRGGVYSVLMGESEPLTAAFDETYFLGISVDGGAELVPRTRLTSSPYALALIGNTNVFASDGNVGIGTASPSEKLEVIGNVKVDGNLEFTGNVTGNLGIDLANLTEDVSTTGNVNAGGNITLEDGLHAPAAEEELRIIRGSINSDGTILDGIGFTMTKENLGQYRITPSIPFSGPPSISATRFDLVNNDRIAIIKECTNESFLIWMYTPSGNGTTDTPFHFIAIGPR